MDLDLNSEDAHEAYAHVLSYTGRHPEALAEIRRAADLDPLSVRTGALEGAFLINAGRADEASAKLEKTLELEPNYWFARQYVSFSVSSFEPLKRILALTEAVTNHREPHMVFLESEPKWNSLRGDPRFRDLLRRIGFAP